VGAGLVTAAGIYLKVRELQGPVFAANTRRQVEAVAAQAATDTLATDYGMSSARMQQFSAIASRFS
jgi:hypothetical protein